MPRKPQLTRMKTTRKSERCELRTIFDFPAQVIMHALRSIPRRWTAICAFMARRNYPGSLLTYEMPRTKERVRTLAQHREGVCRVGPDCWRCESGGIMRT